MVIAFNSVAPSTQGQYKHGWHLYKEFTAEYGVDPYLVQPFQAWYTVTDARLLRGPHVHYKIHLRSAAGKSIFAFHEKVTPGQVVAMWFSVP
jgi:hypothetical protein